MDKLRDGLPIHGGNGREMSEGFNNEWKIQYTFGGTRNIAICYVNMVH